MSKLIFFFFLVFNNVIFFFCINIINKKKKKTKDFTRGKKNYKKNCIGQSCMKEIHIFVCEKCKEIKENNIYM